jgi:hypothetical protein
MGMAQPMGGHGGLYAGPVGRGFHNPFHLGRVKVALPFAAGEHRIIDATLTFDSKQLGPGFGG